MVRRVSYDELVKKLSAYTFKKNRFFSHITVYPIYFLLHSMRTPFHISIFKEQWNDYPDDRYSLFHITYENERNKCSIYFWFDHKYLEIKNIPYHKFRYNCKDFSMFCSTRNKCRQKEVYAVIKNFQKILDKIL